MNNEKLENAIRQRIEEWENRLADHRYFGSSYDIQRCDCVLTILKNVLAEAV